MAYDLSYLMIWVLLALVVGVVVGWTTFTSGEQAPWLRGWFRWSVVAFAVGLVVAVARMLPGRPGFWLETALLFYAAYILGCFFGGPLKRAFAAEEAPSPAARSADPAPFVAPPADRSSASAAAPSPSVGFAAASPAAPPPAGAAASAGPPPAPHVHLKGEKPPGLSAARDGRADDLTLIGGLRPHQVGPLHALGVWHYDQIANWTAANAEWVSHHLGYPGEVEKEDWVGQARELARGDGAPPPAAAAPPPPAVAAPAVVVHAPEPERMGPVDGEDKYEGARPIGFVAPRGGKADDLKRIKGIGPQNEGRLHALGVWHFAQIAEWTPANVHWVGSYLAFPGRIDREDWIAQARTLTSGAETDFSRRVERGEVATSRDAGDKGQHNVGDLGAAGPRS